MSGPYSSGYPDPNRPTVPTAAAGAGAAGGRPGPPADLTSSVGSAGGPSPFSHPGQPLHHGHPHANHGEQLYGPPGGNAAGGGGGGGAGGGYYASSNTAMAASNYGAAPTHASPGGFATVDSSGHAMLPPMHVLPTPSHHQQQQQHQHHHQHHQQQQQQHQPQARRSMGSGDFQSLPAPPHSLMTAEDAQLPMPHGLPQPHPGYQHRGSVSSGGYPLGQPTSGPASASSSGSAAISSGAGLGAASHGLASPTGQAHPGASGQASGGGGGTAQEPKSRSAMACQLCRRQKMKCEGPSKAPCRRCRAAGVECVFESPATNTPRVRTSGGSSWIDGRLHSFESRLAMLEDTAASNSGALVPRGPGDPQAGLSVYPEMISGHERRIAALEQQLYSLQLQVARSQPPTPQQATPYSASYTVQHGGMPGYPPQSAEYDSPGLPAAPLPSHLGGASEYSSPAKHEPDGASGPSGSKVGDSDGPDAHRGKRWKGEPGSGEPDFIARGLVTEEEATMCFESYHLTFSASEGESKIPQSTRLSFDETRKRSPFFLATIISIGARSLSRFETFHATFREALRLARQTFLPDAFMFDSELGLGPKSERSAMLYPTYRPTWPSPAMRAPHIDSAADTNEFEPRLSTLSLKALVLLGLYHAMPDLLMHAWIAGYRFIWPPSMLEYQQMSEEERVTPRGRRCINIARVGIIACLWHSFYTYVRHQLGFMDHTPALVLHHLEVISSSVYAESVTDMVMKTNLEENAILFEAFKQLGPAMRAAPPRASEVYDVVERSLAKLDAWQEKYLHTMVTVSQWGDSPDLKSIVPLHHGRMWLLMYTYTCVQPEDLDLTLPRTRDFARKSVESAIVMLRWAVESRVWMPFSVVGNYVHNVQVPCAIFQLATCARWFPDLLDCALLRPILHRLLQQCDATINGPGATAREISRARRTKNEVQELDRLAFDLCGDETPANGKACPLGPVSNGNANGNGTTAEEESGGLFGQEITASLASLRLELNLWAKPLQAFEGDD